MDIDFDYQLPSHPIVFDVGAYRGDFTALMREKYNAGVHCFEPCWEFWKEIKERFKLDPVVWPYKVALEDEDGYAFLNLKNNSSSLYGDKTDENQEVRVLGIVKFAQAFNLKRIDLLKMNCEGSEYKILKSLIATGWIKNINHIVVQFHPIQGEDKAEMEKLLELTHSTLHKCDHWQWLKLK